MTSIVSMSVTDGIALLTLDVPDRSMNILTPDLRDQLAGHVETIAADDAIIGAIITSGKTNGFLAGADLKAMAERRKLGHVEAVYDAVAPLTRLLRRLETCGKPFVAAVNGTALGGGLEIALACHYRLVADEPKTRLGLPEVKVGLIPGAGGTQRLPRLIGVEKALPLIIEGKPLTPSEAVSLGVFDALAPSADLLDAARAALKAGIEPVQPWDRKGFEAPGGQGGFNPKIMSTFASATSMLAKSTYRNYPAPLAILSAVFEGHHLPMDAALRIESNHFAKMVLDPVSKGMIRTLFINKGAADKLVRRPQDVPPSKVKTLGVLGAGMMGAAIAYISAEAGMDVVLLDVELEAAKRGIGYAAKRLEKAIARGKTTRQAADAVLTRIRPTADFADLAGCDLIIEAVFEDRGIKADVTRKTEAVIRDDVIFGSNTSTLPISGLAEASSRPANYIGVHFFSPADKMPLVEVICGEKTSQNALAKALDYVGQLRKTPIVVNDFRGFYTSNFVADYKGEGFAMLKEGVKPALIENAAKMAGMPVGPLALADEIAIDLSYKVKEQARKDLGAAHKPRPADDVIDRMVLDFDRVGRKAGKGFYDYPEDGPKRLWTGLADHFPLAASQPDVEDVKKRLLYAQALWAVRALERNVITDPADGDIGAVFGLGFPSFTGGPLSMIDSIGAKTFVKECERFADQVGDRFAPPKLLRDMAANEQRFYQDEA